MKTELITYHGWGFSSAIWTEWEGLLSDAVRIGHAERGYFGTHHQPVFDDEKNNKVIMAHSFGLHWCPQSQLERADHLIILSGFESFHPDEVQKRRRSQMILRQMMSRFVVKPKEVLSDFYRNVYLPAHSSGDVPVNFDNEKLLEDLNLIDTSSLGRERLRKFPSVTIIHGEEDQIVSHKKARSLFSKLAPESRYFEIKQAGHAVAFTRAEECLKFLRPVLLPTDEYAGDD